MKKILFTIGVIVASLSIMFITHARVVIGEYVTKAEVKAYYASMSEAFRDVTDPIKNKKLYQRLENNEGIRKIKEEMQWKMVNEKATRSNGIR